MYKWNTPKGTDLMKNIIKVLKEKRRHKLENMSPMKRKWRKISGIILLIILLIFILITVYEAFTVNKITAKEWFKYETGYLYDARDLTAQLDSTVAMYINGNIDESSYLLQLDTIEKEYYLFITERNDKYEYYDIRLDTYDYANKAGPEAAVRSYEIIEKLINDCKNPNNYIDKGKLSYIYTAYTEQLLDELVTVQQCITAEFH